MIDRAMNDLRERWWGRCSLSIFRDRARQIPRAWALSGLARVLL